MGKHRKHKPSDKKHKRAKEHGKTSHKKQDKRARDKQDKRARDKQDKRARDKQDKRALKKQQKQKRAKKERKLAVKEQRRFAAKEQRKLAAENRAWSAAAPPADAPAVGAGVEYETAFAGGAPPLQGVSEVRAFFRTNQVPIYFISPTAFNLLGIDRWVRNFFYLTYFDSFDGSHPRVFVPQHRERTEFSSIEDVCNHLLRDPETLEFIAERGASGKAAFVMFDEETEALAHKAGLEVIHPSAEQRHRLDSKIVTTQLGNQAGVPSVPNTIGYAHTYEALVTLAGGASLGEDLVVQTPYGDSGKTTFFIAGEDDWDRHASHLVNHELKVMRRINNREVAVEAAITRHGTIVGPFMTSLIGHPELTPYRGGWCGNDIFPDALSPAQGLRARELTQKLGARLAQEGYRGFFEVDFLADLDSDELYLGELNPRISGASSMTNVTAGAYADMPLFLFHMLEYMGVDYELDVDEINERWAKSGGADVWSQLIIKETGADTELLTAAPRSGVWKLDDGHLSFARWANDWHNLIDETEAFYLRVVAPGDYRYRGADLGVLVTRGRLQTDDGELTERCRAWIDGIKGQFAGTPIAPGDHPATPPVSLAFKQPAP